MRIRHLRAFSGEAIHSGRFYAWGENAFNKALACVLVMLIPWDTSAGDPTRLRRVN